MKLILFDIDGTLISAGGAGIRSLEKAFNEIFSIKDAFKNLTLAGKTDLQIFKEGLNHYGITESEGVLARIEGLYLQHLKGEINNNDKHVKAGIVPLLERLQGHYTVGLLTGNLLDGARIKLSSLNLWHYFEDGAYGSDLEDRVGLLPIAVARFHKKTGIKFAYESCVVIGDTPRDVAASKCHGAKALAVATGPYSYAQLLQTGADAVFEDLSDTQAVIDFLA
ncbi:MAG: HAD family hydrolase [Nitrospirae bacterium]|nr:HAD family hydrolase [Nitrospirota bacterium]